MDANEEVVDEKLWDADDAGAEGEEDGPPRREKYQDTAMQVGVLSSFFPRRRSCPTCCPRPRGWAHLVADGIAAGLDKRSDYRPWLIPAAA